MDNVASRKFYGRLAIFASGFCFYLSTVAVRWATSQEVGLNSQFLAFARFLVGFLIISSLLLFKRKMPRPRQYRFLLGRAVFNTFAVAFFFKAVEVTTVAAGNILNMTYPIFIAVISWIWVREQRDRLAVAMTCVAFCGILLVLSPGELHIAWENLWGLGSGITAAFAIICLNLARQQNDTDTILFVMFGLGSVLLYLVFWQHIHIPNQVQLFYLVLCASFSFTGQYLLTLGYRYVAAVEGGIIASTRILIAAILGPLITSDPALAFFGWIGALLILGANVYFIVHQSKA